MRKIGLRIAYDGTNYAGWQRQPNVPTVQEEIEKNLAAVTGQSITLHGSGRTDAGVHAAGQVAHFSTTVRMPADKFTQALNVGLPRNIRVLESWEAPLDFHARYSARRKRYRYTIRNAPVASALTGRYEWHLHSPLDYERMAAAVPHWIGAHEFSAFTGAGCPIEERVRTMFDSSLRQEGECLLYEIEGSGFLYNMVRIIVGTLVDIGYGRIRPESIPALLAGQNRKLTGQTAPAQGLMLMSVNYGGAERLRAK